MTALLEWWNFMFLLPLASGLLIGVGIAASGAIADLGDADAGEVDTGDVDIGAVDIGDVNVGDIDPGDVDIGVVDISEVDTGSGDIVEIDSDLSDANGGNVFAQILSFFGLGQGVPMSVMLPILLMSGGLSGLLLNNLFSSFQVNPIIFAPLSMIGSFLISGFTAQGLARVLRKAIKGKPSSIKSGGLIGLRGKGVYAITASSGVAHVKDPYGNIHRISCKTEGAAISAGDTLLVKSFDDASNTYIVEPVALEIGEGN